MNENNDAAQSQSDTFNWNHPVMGAEDNSIARALETLRLLNDKNNPLALGEAIKRARALAETYVQWERSRTLIKDIVVCLSNRQEIAMERYAVSSLYGVCTCQPFEPDAVLHIWKSADEQFGEVQLLSLSLRNIQAGGYQYEKTYENGQTLSLKVESCSDGQFYVSVNFTAMEHTAPSATLRPDDCLLPVASAVGLGSQGLFRRILPARVGKFSTARARRAIRASVAMCAAKPNHGRTLMSGVMALYILVLTFALAGNLSRRNPLENTQVAPDASPAATPEAKPSPRQSVSVSATPVWPAPPSKKRSHTPKGQTSKARHLRKVTAQYVRTKGNVVKKPALQEIMRDLIITNKESGTISVTSYKRRRPAPLVEPGGTVYVEVVTAPSLDPNLRIRRLMSARYIELLRRRGYRAWYTTAGRRPATLRLLYTQREKEEEQVYAEFYVKGSHVWSTRTGCPSTLGLRKSLCRESLKQGQQYREIGIARN